MFCGRGGGGGVRGVGAAREPPGRRRGRERGGQLRRRRRLGPVQRPGAPGRGDLRHAEQEVGRGGVRVEGDQPAEPRGDGRVRRGRHPASDQRRRLPERAQGHVVQMAQRRHPLRDQPVFL